jgi:hypothetical protein
MLSNEENDESILTKSMIKRVLRIAAGVMLLASDPRFIEPVLLNRDKNVSPDNRYKAIERAKRNGVHGYNIGNHIELSPHFRRPHFAIRWTEKGRSVPRLVPVAGSVVNRSKLLEIPSGYEGKEE